jgi:hypothetical protein
VRFRSAGRWRIIKLLRADIHTRIREWQPLDPSDADVDLQTFARRFATCDCDHFSGRVDAQDVPSATKAGANSPSHAARATPNLEERLVGLQVGEINRPLSDESGAARREHRDHEVITACPADQVTVGRRVGLAHMA